MITLLRRLEHSITVNMLRDIAGLGSNEPFDPEPPFAMYCGLHTNKPRDDSFNDLSTRDDVRLGGDDWFFRPNVSRKFAEAEYNPTLNPF